jgi:hypothetical protein
MHGFYDNSVYSLVIATAVFRSIEKQVATMVWYNFWA